MSDEGHGHDWFYPKRLGNLCCRNCGLWHGAWTGDACPGKLERWEFGPSGDYWGRFTMELDAIVTDLAHDMHGSDPDPEDPLSGDHRGPCQNWRGQDPAEYDPYDSCHLHIRKAEERRRRFLELVARAKELMEPVSRSGEPHRER